MPLGAAGSAECSATGDEPTLDTGEYSLGVAVRGVEETDAEADEEALLVEEALLAAGWGCTLGATSSGGSGCHARGEWE